MLDFQTACCWENDVGEEVLKVILLDFGILILVGVVIHMGRAFIQKCCFKQVFLIIYITHLLNTNKLMSGLAMQHHFLTPFIILFTKFGTENLGNTDMHAAFCKYHKLKINTFKLE